MRNRPEDRGALAGIRVIDLADGCAAYCGKLLADLGADVVKIEPPGGEEGRRIGPFLGGRPGGERSLFFQHYNTNKRSVVLDLDTNDGRRHLAGLLGGADVVVTSGSPVELARRGLDPPTLCASRHRLVVAAISPFGQSGPRRAWKSSEIVAQALGGMAFVNGHPNEPPLRSLGPQAHHSACLHAAIGVVLSLTLRERSGRGQLIDVSLQESVVASIEHAAALFNDSRRLEARRGTLHWTGNFRVAGCSDGHALLSSLGDWTTLIEWVKGDGGQADLDEPVWTDFAYRRDHCTHLFDVLDEWARTYQVDDLVEAAQVRRLPFAAVRPIDSLPGDAQLRARGFFVPVASTETSGELLHAGSPYRFSAISRPAVSGAPRLGEHTEVVLAASDGERGDSSDTGDATVTRGSDASLVGNAASARGRALDGIRVVDFTWFVAGPLASRVLADHGADVIKIERLNAADYGSRRGGITGNLNRGKRSLAVNLADQRGLGLVRDLIRSADVVIDNFSARVMPNLGLDYASLCELNPKVIAVNMTGFGATGPARDRVSYGPTLQALAGYTHDMRHAGGEPAGWGFSYSDMLAGYTAALAVLAALRHRATTGVGQCVDLSQFEALVASVGPALLESLANGKTTIAPGNSSPERPAAPHGIYRCRDQLTGGAAEERWCAIAVFDDDDWERFAGVIGWPAWTREIRFSTLAARLASAHDLDRLVEDWTRQHSPESVMETLQAAGIAAGLVANAEDLCLHDEHLAARGYWIDVVDPQGERHRLDGIAPRLASSGGHVPSAAPLLGEHTDEVLERVLGMERSLIDRLRNDGVIG